MARTASGDNLLLGARYHCHRLLKGGDGVDTYLADDLLAGGGPVVVKHVLADQVPLAVRMRLEHEAAILTRLNGATFQPLLAFEHDGDHLYLVQPLHDGQTLAQRLEGGPLSVASTLVVATDVLAALQRVHEHDVLHRDLKPSNVVVQGGEPLTKALLIDFGLARSASLHGDLRDEAVGTARYLAPEQAGLTDVAVDERSDLYSLGVVLYECLAGRPPFEATTVGEVLRQHLGQEPDGLRAAGVPVPRALEAVVLRLLAKDPGQRYQAAGAALADVEEVAGALRRGVSDPRIVIGLHDRRSTLAEPVFVGRATELAALGLALDRARQGRGGLVLLEAESGGGKTRLLDELAVQASRRGAWVLRGHGVDQAGQLPFQLLGGVVTGIEAAASDDPALVARLLARLGDRADAVAGALPALATVLGRDEADLPEAHGETRSLQALPALFDALGTADHPALILLDDCQWADGLTAKLLKAWRQTRAAAGRHVAVVAAFRSEEVGAAHPLRAIDQGDTVQLRPLTPDETQDLAESMAGPLPGEVHATLAQLAEGSPFMAAAVLRGMVECGALVDSARGWTVEEGLLADVQTSRRAALFLIRRLELLTPDALRLLTAGAVLGKEFDLSLAISLSGQVATEVAPALEEARRRRILWADADGRCQFLHDKLREAVLGRLSEAERTQLHGRAAEQIEALEPDLSFELAYHFDAAGEPARCLPYALAAAEHARRQHNLEIAEAHYRMALRSTSGAGDDLRARLVEGLGDVLTLRGSYLEAGEQFELAQSLSTDPLTTAALEAKVGDVAFKRGEPGKGRERLEAALGQLGRPVPKTTLGVAVALLREVLVQVAHTLAPRLFVARRPLDGDGAARELLAVRIYSRLAYVYWFHSGKLRCGWSHLREMNLAERYPPTPELAQAYSEHAPVMTMVPWYARGIAYAERSFAIRAELGDLWGQGQSLGFKAAALYSASRYQEAAQLAQEAVRLLDRTGDRWEANTAGWHVALARYRMGELASAVAVASQVHEAAVDIGDQAAAGISLSPWLRAAEGAVPAEVVRAQLDRQVDDVHTGSEVRLAEAVRLLAAGRPDEAVALLRTARQVVRRAGLRQEYVAPLVPWMATALRLQAAGLPPYARRQRRQVLRQARRAARQAGRLAYWYRNNLPHALREQGLLAAVSGRGARARRLLTESLDTARQQGAHFEEAQTLLARGEVGLALGRRDASEDLRKGRALAERCRPARTSGGEPAQAALSLADRFSTLLEVGHAIASASSAAAVHDAVSEAALTLLRGQRCHVLEVAPGTDRDLCTVSGEAVDELSRTAVRRALETGQPVVVDQSEDVDAAESLVLSDVRSLLCAPITCEGRPKACFYVTARIGRLFGEEEVQLAVFIATLAGAALDHVAGSEARFRTLAQHSSDVISIVGADGVISYQSSSVARVFGFGVDELVGSDLEDWAHPEDRPGLAGFVEAARNQTVENGIVTCRLRCRDGTWRHTETTVTNLLADPSVGGVVLNTRDVSDRQALEAELRRRAWHDPLTDLPNRALFTDRVEQALARGARSRDASIVLYLDLDDFKAVNDSMGHASGDLLLRSVADRLLACVRPGDTVARLGGDEFAVLLDAAPMQDAEQVAGRIVAELGRPFTLPGGERSVRVSVGIAAGRPGIDTAEELVSNADTAMFAAKKRGKNRAEIFVPDMRQLAVASSRRKSELGLALANDELCLYYQPIVAVGTGRTVAVEALLRWRHPRLGLLGPADFVPLAEESGQIVQIGSWVLHQACAQAVAWQRSIPSARGLEMCVNLSPRQLQHPGLVADVAAALETSGLAPRFLTLEITENAVVEDTDTAVRALSGLKALGLRLAVDDFGTGFSALSYLRRFDADVLKVDQSFVAGIDQDAEAAALLWAIASLARALHTEVVAEGVETMAQLEMLTTLGCDRAQGFNWSPPVPAAELARWLGASPGPVAGEPPVRVLLVDDQDHMRGAVSLALCTSPRFVVVGQAADGAAAVDLAASTQPDLVLLDERMPGLSGTEALPGIVAAAPRATVVFLTADDGRRAAPPEPQVAGVIDKGRSLDRLVELLEPLLPLAG
ncbi:MAG: EAL domain-containing protein [Acidimicrobiales bacterium]